LFVAGQLTGVEGYMESAATGIIAGLNAARMTLGLDIVVPPEETILGSLCRFISDPQTRNFQPMNANFGLLPSFEPKIRNKKQRNLELGARSLRKINEFSEAFVN
jgi:methylenetetrahydrofolate--tRNA-(uracil-5-)-methyltransferase